MKRLKEEVVARFIVEDEQKETKEIFVCQATLPLYTGSESYSKKFRLDSNRGMAILQTSDPNIFQLPNGDILRRRKR